MSQDDNPKVVDSWAGLQEELFKDSLRDIGRHRLNYIFRGMANAEWDLRTSLGRLQTPHYNPEHLLIRAFKKYAYLQTKGLNEWHILALAQHHGLPTRILDWSISPYIAAHFATDDMEQMDKDGVIWCVDATKGYQQLPDVLQRKIEQEYAYVFTVDMLDEIAPDLKTFDALKEEPFLVFFEPPSLDERIVNQYAMFSVLSDARLRLDDWLEGKKELYRKLVIPARFKWELRDRLDQLNITERVIYPGLDGLCKWIKRYYTHKDAIQPKKEG